jgi:myo-inositol-1(or 4)-monophosphatase
MNLEQLCHSVCELTKEVGAFIHTEAQRFSASSIEYKGKNDLVSYVDKTAEQQLVAGLQKLLPDSGFITEEKTINTVGEHYNWIIDPLDGTTNFIHGLPCYSISIALLKDDVLVMGIVYEINQKECFYAWEGSSAYLNDKTISVSTVDTLSKSLMATGFPYSNYDRMKPYMEVFDYCMHQTHGLRRLGSAAVDLAYVACGRFEAFYEYGLNPWDVAGGAFIVKQAGGKVSDFKGGVNYIFGKEIIAGNNLMFDEFLDVVKNSFSK